MPAKVRKVRGKNCYSVKTPKRTHAKCTTKPKAQAQARIINSAKR